MWISSVSSRAPSPPVLPVYLDRRSRWPSSRFVDCSSRSLERSLPLRESLLPGMKVFFRPYQFRAALHTGFAEHPRHLLHACVLAPRGVRGRSRHHPGLIHPASLHRRLPHSSPPIDPAIACPVIRRSPGEVFATLAFSSWSRPGLSGVPPDPLVFETTRSADRHFRCPRILNSPRGPELPVLIIYPLP